MLYRVEPTITQQGINSRTECNFVQALPNYEESRLVLLNEADVIPSLPFAHYNLEIRFQTKIISWMITTSSRSYRSTTRCRLSVSR